MPATVSRVRANVFLVMVIFGFLLSARSHDAPATTVHQSDPHQHHQQHHNHRSEHHDHRHHHQELNDGTHNNHETHRHPSPSPYPQRLHPAQHGHDGHDGHVKMATPLKHQHHQQQQQQQQHHHHRYHYSNGPIQPSKPPKPLPVRTEHPNRSRTTPRTDQHGHGHDGDDNTIPAAVTSALESGNDEHYQDYQEDYYDTDDPFDYGLLDASSMVQPLGNRQENTEEKSARYARDFSHHRRPPSNRLDEESDGEQDGDYVQRRHVADYANDEPFDGSVADRLHNDAPAAPGVLTAQKFRKLGTQEAVQQTRNKYLADQEQQQQQQQQGAYWLARQHFIRMENISKCQRPLPRVVQVSNETSKRYRPHCTVLHRCGEDTGCCESTGKVCTVKTYEDVKLYFYVTQVTSYRSRTEAEALTFRNHTECHCVERAALIAKQSRSSSDSPAERLTRSNAMDVCRCPRHFDAVEEDGGGDVYADANDDVDDLTLEEQRVRCRCDCRGGNQPCHSLKNGAEGFAMDDRRCIAEGMCQIPNCTHGDYQKQTGRCPHFRSHHKRTVAHHEYNGYGNG